MKSKKLDIGFVPLVDAAPLIIAQEMGFAASEGLELNLHREASWATIRDRLVWGQYQAAHMLAPMAVSLSAGLGGMKAEIDALSVMSVNGNMIGVRPGISASLGLGADSFLDAATVGKALKAGINGKLRIGVPFPFSMHTLLLHYLLGDASAEGHDGLEIITIPPPYMADAIASGEIDAFSVGEPWGSVAVERGSAELILPSAAIWKFAPEKILASPRSWLEANQETAAALVRSVWRASQWMSVSGNTSVTAEILSRPQYLDIAAEIIERPLLGQVTIDGSGSTVHVPRCIEFFDGSATFPWKSQALWIAEALARQTGWDRAELRDAASVCFRSDLHRSALSGTGADLPGASAKLEGGLSQPTEVGSTHGSIILGPDTFFDLNLFEPELGTTVLPKIKN